MKKSQAYLFKLAAKFSKYAQSQSLQQIIESAASYGEQSPNGIMNFVAQLKKDRADMSIGIDIRTNTLGGYNVYVTPPTVFPSEGAANYAKLPGQIKNYLERHLKDFPQITTGLTVLSFNESSQT